MAWSPALGVDVCKKPIGQSTKHRPNFCAGSVKPDKNPPEVNRNRALYLLEDFWHPSRIDLIAYQLSTLQNSKRPRGHGSCDEPESITAPIDPGTPSTAGTKAPQKGSLARGAKGQELCEPLPEAGAASPSD